VVANGRRGEESERFAPVGRETVTAPPWLSQPCWPIGGRWRRRFHR